MCPSSTTGTPPSSDGDGMVVNKKVMSSDTANVVISLICDLFGEDKEKVVGTTF